MVLLPPDIQRFLHEWEFAITAGDIPAMMQLCDENIEVVVNGVRPVRGAAEVAGMLQVVFARERIQRNTTIRDAYLHESLAVITSDVRVLIAPFPEGEPTPVFLREVCVLRRADTRPWKVAFNMTNMLGPRGFA